jgi:adenylate kinase
MGPTGCRKKEKALTLAEEFNYITVSVGDLLEREISKKSELGKKIKEAQSTFTYGKTIYKTIVADNIVIELVTQQLKELEKEGKDYIIEGYPRTRVQALSLQRMGIVPNKFFILNVNEETINKKVSTTVNAISESMTSDEINAITQRVLLDYNT